MTRNDLVATGRKEPLLPAIGQARPVEGLLSLPQWLTSLIDAVSRTPTGEPTWSRAPEIPASKMPTGAMRAAMEARCSQLEAMAAAGPEERTVAAVTKLMTFYATAGMTREQAAVRGEVFVDAVVDLPGWAVEEAVRRWFRGACGTRNYDFAPSPATLREIASDIASIAAGQLIVLRRILAAKPLPAPLTDEQRAENLRRLGEIMGDAARAVSPNIEPDEAA